jgi:hypothetical protein
MSLSNSVIKTYTQPSCRLEILDRGSPEPGWEGNTTNSQLQFDLQLNDSRRESAEQIGIRGDRHQLAELHQAVSTYVQNLLSSSPDRFNALLSSQPNLSPKSIVSSNPTANYVSHDVSEDTNTNPEIPTPVREIYLQPSGELSHNLFLGPLATQETGQVIDLTMLQLFDLAAVLDEYGADVLTTPAIVRPRKAASTPSTTWASIAAMLLLGVGLTAAVVQLLNSSDEQPQTAQKPAIPRSNNNQQQIALNSSPSPQLSSPDPKSPYNLSSPNSTTGKLSSPDSLPSVPPVGTSNPLLTASPIPGIPSPTAPLSSTQLPTLQSNSGVPSPPPVPTTKITPISPLPGIAQAPSIPKPSPGQQPSISVAKSDVTTIPGINSAANIPRPPVQASPSDIVSSKARSAITEIPDSNPQPTARQKIKAALSGQANETPSELTSGVPSTSSKPNESKIALVNTPQLAEVKDYFVKHWEPPSGLNQTLEYSIVLDVDGSIQRIEPLGKAARTYVDRSSLPLIGEPFVSANPQGSTPRIRLVLSPDGKVQTFVEPD